MKSSARLTSLLHGAAVLIFVVGLGLWLASGARVGWTQTSAVSMQRDEITGIDYPVRRATFIAGVEVPLIGATAAAMLAGLSWLPKRRAQNAA